MKQFEIDQLRRQRHPYIKSIVGLEAAIQLKPAQVSTLARYKEEVLRIDRILLPNGGLLDA